MGQKTQENLTGQTFFIGLDVHKKQWTVAIRTQGILVQRLSMNPFATLDHLAAYVGLVPSITSSDEHDIDHGVPCRHNPYWRSLLIEAAWIAIRKDVGLLRTVTHLTRRMNKKNAIIRIAKKLLNRIRSGWKQHTVSRMESVAT